MKNFTSVGALQFVKLCSFPHMKKTNKDGATFLNNEFGIKIYRCPLKIDGQEFDSFLADLGEGVDQEKLNSALNFLVENI